MKEVDKCIVPIQEIVPLPTVTKVEVKSSEERKPGSDTKSTTVTVEEDVPLSGLNMQLKKVQDDACKAVDKVQRWSLFQTQCIIKGKACKLMIDGGSCTNGISKAMVAALGLSTWRLSEPKRLEWLNSCGMLKITHKVYELGDKRSKISLSCKITKQEVSCVPNTPNRCMMRVNVHVHWEPQEEGRCARWQVFPRKKPRLIEPEEPRSTLKVDGREM
ncbi:hypothetical protein QYE76_023366 [Lolium multiflorum]|uniref:Uncharacterized protein n=1 Tax=Lolium multiflorum TaxID=4521 RepID=A0AAD8REB6_LOLMU|nr:hypothetical protein QYE76_023366 [Lolium multiflorum]